MGNQSLSQERHLSPPRSSDPSVPVSFEHEHPLLLPELLYLIYSYLDFFQDKLALALVSTSTLSTLLEHEAPPRAESDSEDAVGDPDPDLLLPPPTPPTAPARASSLGSNFVFAPEDGILRSTLHNSGCRSYFQLMRILQAPIEWSIEDVLRNSDDQSPLSSKKSKKPRTRVIAFQHPRPELDRWSDLESIKIRPGDRGTLVYISRVCAERPLASDTSHVIARRPGKKKSEDDRLFIVVQDRLHHIVAGRASLGEVFTEGTKEGRVARLEVQVQFVCPKGSKRKEGTTGRRIRRFVRLRGVEFMKKFVPIDDMDWMDEWW